MILTVMQENLGGAMMQISLLIKIFIILVILLVIGVFALVYYSKAKKKKNSLKKKKATSPKRKDAHEPTHSFKELVRIIKRPESTTKDLEFAVENILKFYPKIPAKLGARLHPEYYEYAEVILRLCRHKHTNKTIIITLYKGLVKHNPSYAKEINDALTKGLNSLGV